MGNTFNWYERNSDLAIREVSPTAIDITWNVWDRGYSDTTLTFQFLKFDCSVSVENRKLSCLRLHVSCSCPYDATDPQLYCRLFVKKGRSEEAFLNRILVVAKDSHRTADDTALAFSFLWDFMYYNKDTIAQDELLTLLCKLSIEQQESEQPPEPSTTEKACNGEEEAGSFSEGMSDVDSCSFDVQFNTAPEIERYGELKTNIYSPLDKEIIWRVPDVFHLPTKGSTTISEDFSLPGGKGFIALNAEYDICFMLILFCKNGEGIRSSEWDMRLRLVTAKDEPYSNLTIAVSHHVGPESYVRFFSLQRSEIKNKKDLLLPGGDLTVSITLKDLEISEDGAPEEQISPVKRKPSVNLESDAGTSALLESRYNELLRTFFSLSYYGQHMAAVFKVEEKIFAIYSRTLTLLSIRMPAFASEVYKRMQDTQTRRVDITDLCCLSTFQAFLDFAVERYFPEDLPMDTALELYAMADRFDLDNLKQLCAVYKENDRVTATRVFRKLPNFYCEL